MPQVLMDDIQPPSVVHLTRKLILLLLKCDLWIKLVSIFNTDNIPLLSQRKKLEHMLLVLVHFKPN